MLKKTPEPPRIRVRFYPDGTYNVLRKESESINLGFWAWRYEWKQVYFPDEYAGCDFILFDKVHKTCALSNYGQYLLKNLKVNVPEYYFPFPYMF